MGESARDEAQWLPSALPLWELHSCGSCECLEPWLEKVKKIKLGPQDTIRNILKHSCLKCPQIVHLDLICMNYGPKKARELNWEFESDHKTLKSKGQMRSDWSVLHTIEKIFSCDIRYCLHIFKKKTSFENDMSVQSFETIIIQVLGLPFGTPKEKWHLDVVPIERHIIYYKAGSGASSQKL